MFLKIVDYFVLDSQCKYSYFLNLKSDTISSIFTQSKEIYEIVLNFWQRMTMSGSFRHTLNDSNTSVLDETSDEYAQIWRCKITIKDSFHSVVGLSKDNAGEALSVIKKISKEKLDVKLNIGREKNSGNSLTEILNVPADSPSEFTKKIIDEFYKDRLKIIKILNDVDKTYYTNVAGYSYSSQNVVQIMDLKNYDRYHPFPKFGEVYLKERLPIMQWTVDESATVNGNLLPSSFSFGKVAYDADQSFNKSLQSYMSRPAPDKKNVEQETVWHSAILAYIGLCIDCICDNLPQSGPGCFEVEKIDSEYKFERLKQFSNHNDDSDPEGMAFLSNLLHLQDEKFRSEKHSFNTNLLHVLNLLHLSDRKISLDIHYFDQPQEDGQDLLSIENKTNRLMDIVQHFADGLFTQYIIESSRFNIMRIHTFMMVVNYAGNSWTINKNVFGSRFVGIPWKLIDYIQNSFERLDSFYQIYLNNVNPQTYQDNKLSLHPISRGLKNVSLKNVFYSGVLIPMVPCTLLSLLFLLIELTFIGFIICILRLCCICLSRCCSCDCCYDQILTEDEVALYFPESEKNMILKSEKKDSDLRSDIEISDSGDIETEYVDHIKEIMVNFGYLDISDSESDKSGENAASKENIDNNNLIKSRSGDDDSHRDHGEASGDGHLFGPVDLESQHSHKADFTTDSEPLLGNPAASQKDPESAPKRPDDLTPKDLISNQSLKGTRLRSLGSWSLRGNQESADSPDNDIHKNSNSNRSSGPGPGNTGPGNTGPGGLGNGNSSSGSGPGRGGLGRSETGEGLGRTETSLSNLSQGYREEINELEHLLEDSNLDNTPASELNFLPESSFSDNGNEMV